MPPAAVSLRRGPSVYSFSQLENDGAEPRQHKEDVAFGPLSAVRDLPGHFLPTYGFAAAWPLKRRYIRIASCDSLAIVPDLDDDMDASCSCPSSPASELCCDAWDLFTIQCDADGALPAALTPTTNCHPASTAAVAAQLVPQIATAHKDSTLMETVLTALWDEAAAQHLFRYDLAACETKCIPGQLKFVAQLNEGRATKKRATEFKADKVVQPFDESKFNFSKAYVREVLFQFEPRSTCRSHAALPGTCAEHNHESTLLESTLCGPNPNLVVINVSPIEYGHVLLVPRVMDGLPQLVDPSTLDLALAFAAEAGNSKLRVGYNSLGAYATINHLHYQAYYLDAPFPCELAPTEALPGLKRRRDGISIRRLVRYPVNAFVVEMEPSISAASTPEELAALRSEVASLVGTACMRLAAINQPHNLLICDEGRRVFLFPQGFAARLAEGSVPDDVIDTGINPACFEIAGHMLLKRQQDYDTMGEADMARLLSFASLPEDRFLQLAQLCFGPQQDGKQDKNSTPIFLY